MDAQACLKFHLEHVHPEDQEQFGKYVRKLSEERTEIVYRFLHPEKGVMMIRCSGKKMEDGTIAKNHQDISDIVRLEKDKILETYLAETNEIAESKCCRMITKGNLMNYLVVYSLHIL